MATKEEILNDDVGVIEDVSSPIINAHNRIYAIPAQGEKPKVNEAPIIKAEDRTSSMPTTPAKKSSIAKPTVAIRREAPSPIISDDKKISSVPSPTQSLSGEQEVARVRTYEDLFRHFSPYKAPTPEQLEKERKKQKRDEVFAAIGDGVSALSNLYFTTKGAPNMHTGKDTQSERTRVSYEKLMNQRNKDAAAHYRLENPLKLTH